MPRKRHKPEEVIAKLRQADVPISQECLVAVAVRAIGVTSPTDLAPRFVPVHNQNPFLL